MAAKVAHKYGTQEKLDALEVVPGTVYFITDTQKIYFDTPAGQRVQMLNESDNDAESIALDKIQSLFPDIV